MDSDLKIELPREIRQCGRPTKANTPCKQHTAHLFTPGCRQHCTAEELALGRFISGVYWEARNEGRDEGAESAQLKIKSLEKEVARLQAKEHKRNLRLTTATGDQIVQVDGYAYTWDQHQPPLEVGDKVSIPTTWVDRAQGNEAYSKIGMVTSLGTTYTGSLQRVINRA